MLAAGANDLCTLFDLLLEGASVDAQDGNGWTALTHACHHGCYDIALQLLDSGADLDVQASYTFKDTPLSVAARRGDFDLVRLLIHRGADPNLYVGLHAVRAECYARRSGFHAVSGFLLYHEDQRQRSG